MASTSLAIPSPAPLVTAGSPIEGLEGLGQRDFVVPRWNLVQPTSRFEGSEQRIGQWRNSVTGEFRAHLDVVILAISPSRVLWSGDRSDQRPECTSRDAVTGSVHGACASCQFNPQTNAALAAEIRGGRAEGFKVCSYGYTYLVADHNTQEIAIVGVMGTSVRAVRPLQTQFLSKRRPTYSASVRLATRFETNDRGRFVVMDPSILAWFEQSEIGPWLELHRATRGLSQDEIAVEETESPADARPAPPPAAHASAKRAAIADDELPF